jgi:RNA polymerase sigma-54 factor
MMQMEHRQTQTQTQQLVLTQKMQQALHVLQLSTAELEQFIQQELETNPFLEQKTRKEEGETGKEAEKTTNADDDQEFIEQPFDLDAYADKWDIKRREGTDLSYNPDNFARRQYYEDSITREESLRAHLMSQLHLTTEKADLYRIGERIIIGDIDEKGYFTGDEEMIAAELGLSVEKVRETLAMIQRFEPSGVGAHDVVECLLLQIDAEDPENEKLRTLVRDHLDALMRCQIPKIARAMGIQPGEVEALKKELSFYNPYPGNEYASEPAQYIAPDVVVEKVDDEFVVRLAEERLPDLRVNNSYQKEVKAQSTSKEDKDYIRSKIEAAEWLRRNVTQRQETILKVAQAIVEIQQEFLHKGVEHIRPLTLQDIADVVDVHESTVARTVRGKYIQTPQGLFEMKYFFSTGLESDNGPAQSSRSVQAMIRKIIDGEDKRKPLSDQKIADLLKKEGINIARRTVTKYREGMGILKTSMRREYGNG